MTEELYFLTQLYHARQNRLSLYQ